MIKPITKSHLQQIVEQTEQPKESDVVADKMHESNIEDTHVAITETQSVRGETQNCEIGAVDTSRATELPCFALPKDVITISPAGFAELLKMADDLV